MTNANHENRELSIDELNAVSGGDCSIRSSVLSGFDHEDERADFFRSEIYNRRYDDDDTEERSVRPSYD